MLHVLLEFEIIIFIFIILPRFAPDFSHGQYNLNIKNLSKEY